MRKVLFITSSRADYGLLREVILETQNLNRETYLLVTGSHLSHEFGNTIKEIKNDNVKKIIKRNILDQKFSENKISEYISKSINITSEVIIEKKPDVIVILGDRYELLGSAIAAMILRVPIAHIHGGELTIGAYDDSIRHSITKLSHLHFPVHDVYKKRLIQLGENPKTIFNFGALGAHAISKIKTLKKSEIEKILKIKLNKKIILATFHPVTLEKNMSKYYIKNLIRFLKKLKNYIIIFTSPNFDSESNILRKEILSLEKKKDNIYFYKSLGSRIYISLMKISYLVIGNSSSGVLETPSFGVRTINIGDRQKGRITSGNIINCNYDVNSMSKAFNKLKKKSIKSYNPFFKKKTPIKIAKKILDFKFTLKKQFFDIGKN